MRETIELPITNPELFRRVGIKPPKGCLIYGPPGTGTIKISIYILIPLFIINNFNQKGKTLLARALACNVNAKFLKVVASGIVDKYIGESARVIREMFAFAREN